MPASDRMAGSENRRNSYGGEENRYREITATPEPLETAPGSSSYVKTMFQRFSLRRTEKGEPGKPSFIRRSFSYGQRNKSIWRDKSKDLGDGQSFIHNIPPKPLSVLQIDDLLKDGSLVEAYPSLLFLRLKFQHEQETHAEESCQVNLSRKEKDLSLLYETLRDKVSNIVRQSVSLTLNNKELLSYTASIIREEEKREGEVGGMTGWRDVWRAAVQEGVRDGLSQVPLDSREQNPSWLTLHLGLLGKTIVEQLENVKAELVKLYPPNFNVFETYSSSCHEFVAEHLNVLLGKVTELADFSTMLDFCINSYYSETILGSPSLQPEMNEQKTPSLSDGLIDKIKKKYYDCLQKNIQTSLDIIRREQEEVWRVKAKPKEMEDGKFLTSEIHMNIYKMISQYAENAGNIDVKMKDRVVRMCLEALKPFPERFEDEFIKQSGSLLGSDLLDCCLWAEYHIAYINSFSTLRDHMTDYKEACPDQVEQVEREVERLALRLRQALLEQFKVEIKPFIDSMMTKKWLNSDADFKELTNRIEVYSGYKKFMKPLPAQNFANEVHYHVVKEYISELLKNKYSCKGKKNETAAAKIREQWNELKGLFCEMESTLVWLHPIGDQISKIIEQEHGRDIKDLLKPLVESYPDISKKHLLAILYFRDHGLSIERYHLIQHFTELKQNLEKKPNAGSAEYSLFSDIK
ncbi:exocyst complex component 3-like protein 4 isoform X2 [Brachyhypopomus gauderio]